MPITSPLSAVTGMAMDRTLEAHLAATSQLLNMCFQTEDSKEGIQSFLEKREAVYKGR